MLTSFSNPTAGKIISLFLQFPSRPPSWDISTNLTSTNTESRRPFTEQPGEVWLNCHSAVHSSLGKYLNHTISVSTVQSKVGVELDGTLHLSSPDTRKRLLPGQNTDPPVSSSTSKPCLDTSGMVYPPAKAAQASLPNAESNVP